MAAPDASSRRRIARVCVDCALAALLVAVMATALVQEAPHEYLGCALLAAVVAHIVLNRRWFAALFRGHYSAVRVLQVVAVAGVAVCMGAQMASALVLSKFAFGFLPALPGASWARSVHLVCSYWGFVFAFAHVGLHAKGFARLARRSGKSHPSAAVWAMRAAVAIVALLGAVSFVQLDFAAYLFGRVQFAGADYDSALWLIFARYASVAVLIATVFYWVRSAIEAGGKRSRS